MYASVQSKVGLERGGMPQNGVVNKRFGVYQNLCCHQEILLREGEKFPDCRNHPKLTTVWKPVDVGESAARRTNRSKRRSA